MVNLCLHQFNPGCLYYYEAIVNGKASGMGRIKYPLDAALQVLFTE